MAKRATPKGRPVGRGEDPDYQRAALAKPDPPKFVRGYVEVRRRHSTEQMHFTSLEQLRKLVEQLTS